MRMAFSSALCSMTPRDSSKPRESIKEPAGEGVKVNNISSLSRHNVYLFNCLLLFQHHVIKIHRVNRLNYFHTFFWGKKKTIYIVKSNDK